MGCLADQTIGGVRVQPGGWLDALSTGKKVTDLGHSFFSESFPPCLHQQMLTRKGDRRGGDVGVWVCAFGPSASRKHVSTICSSDH
jgi:hypothetical protein